MDNTSAVPYGTLDLLVLKTLESMGTLHGYGIARRIEQVAEGSLALNQGTIYPALLRLDATSAISRRFRKSAANNAACRGWTHSRGTSATHCAKPPRSPPLRPRRYSRSHSESAPILPSSVSWTR